MHDHNSPHIKKKQSKYKIHKALNKTLVKVPINFRTQFLTTSSLPFRSTFVVNFTELWTTKVALLIYENGLRLFFSDFAKLITIVIMTLP